MSQPAEDREHQFIALASGIAAELWLLARHSDEMQEALSRVLRGQDPADDLPPGLQRIDRISQGLTDLARLIEAIGGREALPPPAELAACMHLHDLARALFPATKEEPAAEDSAAEPSELSLF